MAKVIWTKPALNDVNRAYEYIEEKSGSTLLAERISLELMDAAYERMARLPNSGALVDELKEIGARELYKHSYRIIYIQRSDICYVIQCIYSSRDLIQHIDPQRWADIIQDEESN